MFVVVVHGNPTMWIGIPSVQGDEEEREIGVNVIGGGGTGNPMAFTKIHHRVLCIPIGWSREDDKDAKNARQECLVGPSHDNQVGRQ